jgi:hypothetical protein
MAMAMDTLSSRLNGQLLGKLGRWSSRLRLKTKIYELGFDATWIRKSVGRVPSCQQRCRSKKKKGTSEGGGLKNDGVILRIMQRSPNGGLMTSAGKRFETRSYQIGSYMYRRHKTARKPK